MTVDMSQFYQTYFEESFEGLDAMESNLLNLDVGAADKEIINTIFRAAHSIKGGSATFGFDAVASFTHVLETLLDEMRDGKRMVSQDSVDLMLASVDTLRDMLASTRDGEEIDTASVGEVQKNLEAMLNNEEVDSAPPAANTSASAGVTDPAPEIEQDDDEISIWEIGFAPKDDLIRTGNDPVRIIRELSGLGELSVTVNLEKLPEIYSLDPEICFLSWTFMIEGCLSESDLKEPFEWVEDSADISFNHVSSFSRPTNVIPEEPEVEQQPQPTIEPASAPAPQGAAETPEVEPAKPAAETKKADAPAAAKSSKASTSSDSIRVSTDKVDALINMVGELVITQSMLGELGENINAERIEKLKDGLAQLERNTRELQESVMRIRMLPISFVFQRFPRMVRDLTNKLGKNIELKLSGEQTELDKTVMEKIGDPMVHLVRNSVDHGIESPEERLAKGKPEQGTVLLDAYHQGGNIVIEITDDGAGLNLEKIIQKARDNGLVGEKEQVSEERACELIFEPGFSTAQVVSDVSGRGVGMDVVKRNIRELGGTVDVKTRPGEGSTFTIKLPLTLAILDGQLVKVGNQTYIIPLISIIESIQVRDEKVNIVGGEAELYKLRDDYIPIVRLYDVFSVQPEHTCLTDGLLVVVEGDGQHVGLFVDDLLGQQQVVIKSLETNFRRVDGVSGATILGDGTVALILDMAGLITLSRGPNGGRRILEEKQQLLENSDDSNSSSDGLNSAGDAKEQEEAA